MPRHNEHTSSIPFVCFFSSRIKQNESERHVEKEAPTCFPCTVYGALQNVGRLDAQELMKGDFMPGSNNEFSPGLTDACTSYRSCTVCVLERVRAHTHGQSGEWEAAVATEGVCVCGAGRPQLKGSMQCPTRC